MEIINSEITTPSNYRALKNLDEWLKKNRIVGITGIDTRNLTNFIRDKGAPKGTISYSKNNIGLSWIDISTGEIYTELCSKQNFLTSISLKVLFFLSTT